MSPPRALSSWLSGRRAAALLAGAAVAALAAAFFAQYVMRLEPCPLCLYERVPYAIIVVVAGAAAALALGPRARAGLIALAALAALADSGLAGYHVGVEQGVFEASAACTGSTGETAGDLESLRAQLLAEPPAARCDRVPWSAFGISIAGYNALYSALLAVFAGLAAWRTGAGR